MPADNHDIVAAARAYIGAPWRHQGRTMLGMDCVGLLICSGNDTGAFDHFDYRGYGRRPKITEFLKVFHAHMDSIRIADAVHGDAVVIAAPVWACHAGIIASDGAYPTLIHAHMSRRQVIEEPLSMWIRQVRGAFRFRRPKT